MRIQRGFRCISLTLVLFSFFAGATVCAAQQSSTTAVSPAIEAKAKEWLHRFQTSDIDRSQLEPVIATQLTSDKVRQVADQLRPLGDPISVEFISQASDQDSTTYQFLLRFKAVEVTELLALDSAGKIRGLSFEPYSDPNAMKKLRFLAGNWTCTVKGGPSNNLKLNVSYSFSPDGHWMVESSNDVRAHGPDWATQVWGYDATTKKLVAYQFTSDGLATKTVQGWVNGDFVSRRDDNGAIVSLKPVDANSIQWIIESSDGTFRVTQDCSRKKP